MLNMENDGIRRWETLNHDLTKLREELINETNAQLKDVANVRGNFRKCLGKIEVKIEKLMGEWPKDPKLK